MSETDKPSSPDIFYGQFQTSGELLKILSICVLLKTGEINCSDYQLAFCDFDFYGLKSALSCLFTSAYVGHRVLIISIQYEQNFNQFYYRKI